MIRLAVFDLDGTLLETLSDIAAATNWTLNAYERYPLSRERIRKSLGLGVDHLVKRVMHERDIPAQQFIEFKRVYLERYRQHMMVLTRPYAGVEHLLQELFQAGIGLGVLSNKPEADVTPIIKHYFPDIDFRFVLGKSPDFPGKPDPTYLNHVIGQCGVKAQETVYIGDTWVDIETAKNASVMSIGVTWGFGKKRELNHYHADHIVSKSIEIKEIILGEKG